MTSQRVCVDCVLVTTVDREANRQGQPPDGQHVAAARPLAHRAQARQGQGQDRARSVIDARSAYSDGALNNVTLQ